MCSYVPYVFRKKINVQLSNGSWRFDKKYLLIINEL